MASNATTPEGHDEVSDFEEVDERAVRMVYLVTYSQADLIKFPTRQSFGQAVQEAFDAGSGKVKTVHWATCLEKHQRRGYHYHTAIKMSGGKRWPAVKQYLNDIFGIVCNFTERHGGCLYINAYRYVTKKDNQIFHSDGHPNLRDIGSPRTKKCVAANQNRKRKRINDAAAKTAAHSFNFIAPT